MNAHETFHPYGAEAGLAESDTMNEPEKQDVATGRGGELSVHGAAMAEEGTPPEWIELVPAGEFRGRDGRGPFRLKSPEAVIAATRGLGMEAGIPIDYDHATDFAAPEGRPAPAAGWIRKLEARDGAIWGLAEWTRHGAAAVTAHEYRYISPVFEYAKSGEVVRLLRAALTNNPNLYLSAISARAASEISAGPAGRSGDEEQAMEKFLGEMREMLALEEETTTEEIAAAVRAIMAGGQGGYREARESGGGEAAGAGEDSGGADPARYVPVAHFQRAVSELNTLRAARARERAEHAVDNAIRTGKLVPAQREWAVAYCQADFRGFENFVARQPAVALGEIEFEGEPAAAANRAGGEGNSQRRGGAITATEMGVCDRLGIRPEDYIRRKATRGEFLLNRS